MERTATRALAILLPSLVALAACDRSASTRVSPGPTPPGALDEMTNPGADSVPEGAPGHARTSGEDPSVLAARKARVDEAVARARQSGVLDLAGLGLRAVPESVAILAEPDFPPDWEHGSESAVHAGSGNVEGSDPEPGTERTSFSGPIEVDISGNELSDLPSWMARFTRLERLDLSGNRLESLPPVVTEIRSLKHLDLGGNPHGPLPPEVVRLELLTSIDLAVLHAEDLLRLIDIPGIVSLPALPVPELEPAGAGIPYEDVSLARAWSTSVVIEAPGPMKPSGPPPRSGFFLASAQEQILLLSDHARFEGGDPGGAPPCRDLPPSRLKGIPREGRLDAIDARCERLFVYGPSGVTRVVPTAVTVASTRLDACTPETRAFDVRVTLPKLPADAWFVTSVGTEEGAALRFSPPEKLLREGKREFPAGDVRPPPGFVTRGITWYDYPEKPGAELGLVEAEGFGGGELPLVRTRWQGLFLFSGKTVTRLAETDSGSPCIGNHEIRFGGLFDLMGDGDLDVLLLGEVPMVLERLDAGFRTRTAPSLPCSC